MFIEIIVLPMFSGDREKLGQGSRRLFGLDMMNALTPGK
jgi:hypothetical protein